MVKKLFADGLLAGAYISPAPMEHNHFVLSFRMVSGKEEPATHARKSTLKIYKRLNGAMKDVEQIGFNEVTIRFR